MLILDSPGRLVGYIQVDPEMFPPAPVSESYRARLRCSKCGGPRRGHTDVIGESDDDVVLAIVWTEDGLMTLAIGEQFVPARRH